MTESLSTVWKGFLFLYLANPAKNIGFICQRRARCEAGRDHRQAGGYEAVVCLIKMILHEIRAKLCERAFSPSLLIKFPTFTNHAVFTPPVQTASTIF